MLYRVLLEVYVEADSLTDASNAANAPIVKDMADRARRMGVGMDTAHPTRSEVTHAERL